MNWTCKVNAWLYMFGREIWDQRKRVVVRPFKRRLTYVKLYLLTLVDGLMSAYGSPVGVSKAGNKASATSAALSLNMVSPVRA